MSKPLPVRVHNALVSLFNEARKTNDSFHLVYGKFYEHIPSALHHPGFTDIFFDLLGVPEDNTLEFDLNSMGYQPKCCFCRDGLDDEFREFAGSAEDFISLIEGYMAIWNRDGVFDDIRTKNMQPQT